MTRILLATVLISCAAAANAQDVDCIKPSTQYEINICTAQDAKRADAELNRLWKILKPVADARGEGAALLAGQRAWLKYRDATCEAERASFGSGSFAPAAFAMCIERMTKARNAELRAMI